MGVHQAVRIQAPTALVDDTREESQEAVPVFVGEEDGALSVPRIATW
jgi:hypothetical protein